MFVREWVKQTSLFEAYSQKWHTGISAALFWPKQVPGSAQIQREGNGLHLLIGSTLQTVWVHRGVENRGHDNLLHLIRRHGTCKGLKIRKSKWKQRGYWGKTWEKAEVWRRQMKADHEGSTMDVDQWNRLKKKKSFLSADFVWGLQYRCKINGKYNVRLNISILNKIHWGLRKRRYHI